MSSGLPDRSSARPAIVGLAIAIILADCALIIPRATNWIVNADNFPPLHAHVLPRVGPGTIPAFAIAILAVIFAPRLARHLSYRWLLLGSFVVGLAWLLSLAFVDGVGGISAVLVQPHEYLVTARGVTNISTMLHEFISRIPLHSHHNWTVQVAGHPPGALLFFVFLVHIGLGSGFAAGMAVTVIAATIPIAVLLTLRRLGAEVGARAAAPFLVLAPAAIWEAVSGDAVFAAVAAWGLFALACAATAKGWPRIVGWSLLSGALLGYTVFLSYGLVLLAILALAVLFIARSWRPIPIVLGVVAVIVFAFAAGGFEWWRAYPILSQRYYDGIASVRPYSYWIWGDLACLVISAGPVVGSAIAASISRVRSFRTEPADLRPIILLALAGLATVLIADVSGMSKAEVERIWLPFIPWMLVGTALLPARWVRVILALQLALALTVQHLLHIVW
ncbi:MAG TPA: hypothetical protein VGF80_14465 [Galbitalea sp.]|jgi:hypothetical protein